jgi:predicted DNA-binding transcriptional regulator AlpA
MLIITIMKERFRTMSDYLNDVEAAQVLNLSEKTLRTWRMKGKGPAYRKFENAVRYGRADLEKWAASRIVIPGPKYVREEK